MNIKNQNILDLMDITYKQSNDSIYETIKNLSSPYNKLIKQNGGGLIPNNSIDIFYEYLDKGKLELLKPINSSLYGILLKLKIENIDLLDDNMVFYNININRLRTKKFKINNLCIKLVPTFFRNYSNEKYYLNSIYKQASNRKNLIYEIETQNLIAKTTNMYFEPVTPFILHSQLVSTNNINTFMDFLIKSCNDQNLINTLIELKNILITKKYCLTIIVMDLIEKDIIIKSNINNETDILLAGYEFLRTIINSKVVSLDTHHGNFICVKSEDYFFKKYDKRFYMIDFGICKFINNRTYNILLNYYKKKDFYNLFVILFKKYHDENSNYTINFKKFIYKILNIYQLNSKMNEIIILRDKRIDQLLLDEKFFYLTRDSSLINFIYTYSLYKKIFNNFKEGFIEYLENINIQILQSHEKATVNLVIFLL
jgi:hypothetical protein